MDIVSRHLYLFLSLFFFLILFWLSDINTSEWVTWRDSLALLCSALLFFPHYIISVKSMIKIQDPWFQSQQQLQHLRITFRAFCVFCAFYHTLMRPSWTRHNRIKNYSKELFLISLCGPKNHHSVLDGSAVQVVERHVLGYREGHGVCSGGRLMGGVLCVVEVIDCVS